MSVVETNPLPDTIPEEKAAVENGHLRLGSRNQFSIYIDQNGIVPGIMAVFVSSHQRNSDYPRLPSMQVVSKPPRVL